LYFSTAIPDGQVRFSGKINFFSFFLFVRNHFFLSTFRRGAAGVIVCAGGSAAAVARASQRRKGRRLQL